MSDIKKWEERWAHGKSTVYDSWEKAANAEIAELRARVAELEAEREDAEPVATAEAGGDIVWIAEDYPLTDTSLFTHPPKRQPMTIDEINDAWAAASHHHDDEMDVFAFARAIEAHHKIEEPK